MLLSKMKFTALSFLLLLSVAASGGWVARSLARKENPVQNPAIPTATVALRDDDRLRPAAKSHDPATPRMTVTGRVLDPDGKPVKGAVVDLVIRPRTPWVGASDEMDHYTLLGRGESGDDGGYRLDVPRTASTRVFGVTALAGAPGYGLVWAELNPDAERPAAELKLQPEQPVHVRLVDVTGAPARGVEVRVVWIAQSNDKGTGDGAGFGADPPRGIRAWPRPVTTDDEGRLTLAGIGRGANLGLHVRDMRFARQDLYIDAAKLAAAKEAVIALEPARIIAGRVLAADTGQPIPNAVVSAATRIHNEHANGFFTAKFRADGEGRFAINPIAGEDYVIRAFPTGGEPY
jgi:hypothetical protein